MTTLFCNANLLDVEHQCQILPNTSVLVDGDKIVSVSGDTKSADRVIDLQGAYLLPGLINLHVHLFGTGAPSKALSGGSLQKFLMAVLKTPLGAKIMDGIITKNVSAQLKSGTTTIRAVGDFCYSDVRIRDKIKAGKLLGPRMLVSGPAITVPGGHGDGNFARTGETVEELTAFVEQNVQAGVDWIKICVTGGVMDAKEIGHPGELKMNLEQTKAVCDRAHALGMRVASHTESEEGLEVALRGGVDTIEHGAAINDEMLELYRQNGSAMIITLSPCVPLSFLPPQVTKLDDKANVNTKIVGKGMVDGAKRAMREQIPLGLGTDAACPLCTQYNMSPADAICTATLRNAQIAGIDAVTGSVTAGKAADLLVVGENPLEDLRALREPLYVMANGRLLEHPQQEKMEDMEKLLDSIDLESLDFSVDV